MSNFWSKQPSSRQRTALNIATASSTVAATVSAAFAAQTRQIRIALTSAVTGDGALFTISDGTPTL